MSETTTTDNDGLGGAPCSAFGPGSVFDGIVVKLLCGGVEVVVMTPTIQDLKTVLDERFPEVRYNEQKFGSATISVRRFKPNASALATVKEKAMETETGTSVGVAQPPIVRRLPAAQQEVIDRLKRGETLMWCGDAGPEISGRPFWPQKRTVRAMLRDGLLVWGDYLNETQKQCGMRPLILPPNATALATQPAPQKP